MTGSDVPVLPRGVRCHHDRARGVDVLLGPERVLILDAIGLAILTRVDGQATVSDIAANLATVYEAPQDVIEPDVVTYLTDLRDKGFVHVIPH